MLLFTIALTSILVGVSLTSLSAGANGETRKLPPSGLRRWPFVGEAILDVPRSSATPNRSRGRTAAGPQTRTEGSTYRHVGPAHGRHGSTVRRSCPGGSKTHRPRRSRTALPHSRPPPRMTPPAGVATAVGRSACGVPKLHPYLYGSRSQPLVCRGVGRPAPAIDRRILAPSR